MNNTRYMFTDYAFGKWLLNNMLENKMTCTDVGERLRATRQVVRLHILGINKPSYVWVIAYCSLFNEDPEKIWELV
jgi:hypothetical protein